MAYKDKDKQREYQRLWSVKNRERLNAVNRAWKLNNREYIKAYRVRYNKENRSYLNEYQSRLYNKDKTKFLLRKQKWRLTHREQASESNIRQKAKKRFGEFWESAILTTKIKHQLRA